MAKTRIHRPDLAGSTVYVVVWNDAEQAWNGSAFVTYSTSQDDFDQSATAVPSAGIVSYSLPTGAAYWKWFIRSGATADINDQSIQQGDHVQEVTGNVTGSVGSVAAAVTVGTINSGVITATSIASGALTAAKFAAGAFDSVWSVTSRLLTAGTNIVLAKGTGVTGFNDPTVSQITSDIDANSTKLATIAAKTAHFPDVDAGVAGGIPVLNGSGLLPVAVVSMDPAVITNSTIDDNALAGKGDWNTVTPPSASAVATAVASQTDIAAALQTIDTNLDAKVSDVEGGSGTPRPVNQVPVPIARVWTLKPTDDGLQGELPLSATLGDDGKVWSIEYRHDLANNGRLLSIDAVTLVSGTSGGITFGNDINDVDDYGVDRSQAKVRIGLVQVGAYTIRVNVTYDDADGGGTSQGEVKLVVK